MNHDTCLRADETSGLRETVTLYFEAERQGDTARVWEMIAPSSAYKRAYSYPFYVEMMRLNTILVKDFKIEEIIEVLDNDDGAGMPSVEKIALVRVSLTLTGGDGIDSRHSSIFTFLREEGRWYKG